MQIDEYNDWMQVGGKRTLIRYKLVVSKITRNK